MTNKRVNEISLAYAFYEYNQKGFEAYKTAHEYTEEFAVKAFEECRKMFHKYMWKYSISEMKDIIYSN